MLKRILLFVLFCYAFSVNSQEWNQNKEATKVLFSAQKFKIKVKGTFKDVIVHTNFNSKKLEESYVHVKILSKSISTGIKGRDKKILSKNYFYGDKYQFIELKSSKINKNEKGAYFLLADVTIKGITKQLKIPIEVLEKENSISIVSNFKIANKDFRVGEGSFGMSKSANIVVAFSGSK